MTNDRSSVIKIVGIGNCGCTILTSLMQNQISGIDFIACDTDPEILSSSSATTKILLSSDIKEGLEVSSVSESVKESINEFNASIAGSDAVILVAGLGGLTGSNATPLFSEEAMSQGILTIGVAITPFTFEGSARRLKAEAAIAQLRELHGSKSNVYVLSNNEIIGLSGSMKNDIRDVYRAGDAVISRIITEIINTLMHNSFTESDLDQTYWDSEFKIAICDQNQNS